MAPAYQILERLQLLSISSSQRIPNCLHGLPHKDFLWEDLGSSVQKNSLPRFSTVIGLSGMIKDSKYESEYKTFHILCVTLERHFWISEAADITGVFLYYLHTINDAYQNYLNFGRPLQKLDIFYCKTQLFKDSKRNLFKLFSHQTWPIKYSKSYIMTLMHSEIYAEQVACV